MAAEASITNSEILWSERVTGPLSSWMEVFASAGQSSMWERKDKTVDQKQLV